MKNLQIQIQQDFKYSSIDLVNSETINTKVFFKCFWKRRKFATKWYITHFVFIFSQLSEIVLGS